LSRDETFRSRAYRPVDIYQSVGLPPHALLRITSGIERGDRAVESNQRYYFRRAAEERMAAQRAITDTARQWHARLAQQFAARAAEAESLSAA
jgi:hypothetical protein